MKRQEAMQKASELLNQMTVEEKVAQMIQVPYTTVSHRGALRWAELGAGSFLHVLGDNARELQRTALKTRLGIPVIFGIDAIHGHGLNPHATIFPSQLAAACSWNPDIVRKMGEVTACEVATDGLHWTFSPVLCLGRDTRWGRVDETFGEDPMLAGELGAAIVRGYQGDDLDDDEHILACAKHYLAYGEAVGARDACDSEVTERKIREVFLPPFEKAVKAGCATIMTAYGSIDGLPLTINHRILHDILRDELGFNGFVVTDWDNARSLVTRQFVKETIEDAAVAAAQAGNDMIMTSLEYYDAMLNALKCGQADISTVDEAVLHILTIKYEMGLFDRPEKKGRSGCIGCEAHLNASLDAARSTITLLKNDGMLPLSDEIRTVAVIGPAADDIRAQYGDWTYFSHPNADKHAHPERPYVTLKEGIEAVGQRHKVQVLYAEGCSHIEQSTDDLVNACEIAKNADAIIYAVGDMIDQIGESKDRANLSLSGRQDELFEALLTLGKPICTVLIASKPLCIVKEAEGSNAVICAFNGGMFGGQAIAEAVFGELNPSGHLPISFPRHSGQVPVYYNYLPGWHNGNYCDLPASPLFAFGEGLSYTSFELSGLSCDSESLTVHLHVQNTGNRQGSTVVQIYQHDLVSSVLTPVKRLIAFERVTLEAGSGTDLVIPLHRDDFALVNTACQTVVEPGSFDILAGLSSKDEDLLRTTILL
ncbi:MAG: glycoside hydrolase family 3 C-terminal domain-containing protein [Clostridia bacterium]|nr:glycoside hydrolase family 3 C-terminal domain-containing protein [Clostridia bacterium]